MKEITKGIVFSNDINLILNGSNALDYKYDKNLPSYSFIEELRSNFFKTTQEIFENVTIITEEEMTESLNNLVSEVIALYPHCNSR